jgi:hypothetical protein
VFDGFRFLADLTETQKTLAADTDRKNWKNAEALVDALTAASLEGERKPV